MAIWDKPQEVLRFRVDAASTGVDLAGVAKKKKKVDYVALGSRFMRIPKMDVGAARDLLDIGFTEIHELAGRAPEVLFEEVRKIRPDTPMDRLYVFRMAVYFAETPEPDKSLMTPWAWN